MARRDAGAGARYEEIAIDLARRIVEREFQEGDRLLGRSALAGTYKVSPETIRRAIAILHERGVVRAIPGSGIRVVSRRLAAEFLESLRTLSALEQAQAELSDLLARRRELDDRITQAAARLARLARRALEASRRLGEVAIPEGSWLVGETLASARLRNLTGATVIGVVRGAEEHYSPPPDFRLQAGDLLMVVGSERARARVEELARLPVRPAEEAGAGEGVGEGAGEAQAGCGAEEMPAGGGEEGDAGRCGDGG